MHAFGKLKHTQPVLVKKFKAAKAIISSNSFKAAKAIISSNSFKAAKAIISSNVKGHKEYVCNGQTAARETITFLCLLQAHALPKLLNYMAQVAKHSDLEGHIGFLLHNTKD